MRKILFILFVLISTAVAGQHPCPAPTVIINLPPERNCAGDATQLSVAVSGGNSPYTYLWEPSGGTTSSIGIVLDTTITYTVMVKNSCGDSTTKSITIDVGKPKVSLPPIMYIALGDSVIIVAKGNGFVYQWAPTLDGRCLNPPLCDSIKVSPPANVIYTVTTTDSLGCQAKAVDTVVVGLADITPVFNEKQLNVYPNPSSTSFTIVLPNKVLLKVCDITGRLLFSQMENAGTISFGDGLSPGMYFLFINGTPGGKLVKL